MRQLGTEPRSSYTQRCRRRVTRLPRLSARGMNVSRGVGPQGRSEDVHRMFKPRLGLLVPFLPSPPWTSHSCENICLRLKFIAVAADQRFVGLFVVPLGP